MSAVKVVAFRVVCVELLGCLLRLTDYLLLPALLLVSLEELLHGGGGCDVAGRACCQVEELADRV